MENGTFEVVYIDNSSQRITNDTQTGSWELSTSTPVATSDYTVSPTSHDTIHAVNGTTPTDKPWLVEFVDYPYNYAILASCVVVVIILVIIIVRIRR